MRAAFFAVQAIKTVIYPFEWSTMDGYYVFHGLRLLSGEPLYFGYQSLLMPFEYAPLYACVTGILAKIFGIGVWYERAFSLLCAFAIGALIFRTVRKNTSTGSSAIVASLLFFAPASLSVWYIVRGIDILTTLSGLLAVAIAAEAHGRIGRNVVVVVLLTAAFFTKQTAMFPAVAIILFHLSSGRWKEAAVVGIGFGGLSTILFFLFQHLSGGWFYDNAFLMTSQNPYALRWLADLSFQFVLALLIAVPIAFLQAIRKLRSSQSLWSWYFCLTLAACILAAKAGAALSYFIPLFSAICILTGLWLGDNFLKHPGPKLFSVGLALLLVQSLAFFMGNVSAPSRQDYQQAMRLDSWIQQRPGPILTERIDSFATRNGRELNVEAVQLPVLVMYRKYDPDLVIRPVSERKFSLIIYSGIYFGGIPAIKKAIFDNYRVVDEIEISLFFGKWKYLVMAPIEPQPV